ncbi:MAG: tryptophan synthase subunit alpha [Frankiaceae bacterium]
MSGGPGPGSTAGTFARARAEGRALLIGYLPAGFPSRQGCLDAYSAMVGAGVDIVEVGLPYSDPLMDGPTIQAAVDAALAGGVRTRDVVETVRAVSALGTPSLVMSYWNPIERYGVEAFAADLAAAGGAGAITPDLTVEEAGAWLIAARPHGLDTVFLVAPSSPPARIDLVCRACRGFVYAASTMGVTGARATVGDQAQALVGRVREHTDLPVAVGLGVSSGEQAGEVAAYADAVIVGSAFVRCLLDASNEHAGTSAVADLAAELAAGVRSARTVAGGEVVP